MNNSLAKLIRAARGPVLLMTLGVLLAVGQATRMTFDQTFPILIIVFGLMWLLERMMPKGIDPVYTGGATVTLPPMPAPLSGSMPSRDPFLDDPTLHIHREVYGAPARPAEPAPIPRPASAPIVHPDDLPTAEHPTRQQQLRNQQEPRP